MYKTIPEFPEYSISESGEVYSNHVNRCLSPYVNNNGYLCVKLQKDSNQYTQLVSRLLCRVYKDLPSLMSPLEVDHKDNNTRNNELDNLQVMSTEDHLIKTLSNRAKGNIYSLEDRLCSCGKFKHVRSKTCMDCYRAAVTHDISREDIEFWVRNYSWVRASKELGLSDNGLRKKYKALGGNPKDIKK